jgi:hypothetical protein
MIAGRDRTVPDRGALEQELQRLHERRGALEERIRFAQARGRYGEGGAAEEGREDEGAAIVELDRLMTRIAPSKASSRLPAAG